MKELLLTALTLIFLQTTSAQFGNSCKCLPGSDMHYEYATCRLSPNPGVDEAMYIEGAVRFRQRSCFWCKEAIEIYVSASNLPTVETGKKKHGFHVYEHGDLSGGCISAGGHYNPFKANHGASNSTVRHVGDLGNVEDLGSGNINEYFRDEVVSITGNNAILGRSIVLHAGEDDLGKGGNPESLKTGNAGIQLACCVIGRAPKTSWLKPNVPLSRRTTYRGPQPCSAFIRETYPELCHNVLYGDF